MTYKKTHEATRDEHATIGGIDGKKTFIFDNAGNQITNFGGSASATVAIGSSATIFAVVNTAAAGQASVVLDTGSRFIGLATVNIGSSNATLFAVVNTAAAGQASVVLDTGANFIGLVTVANTVPVTFSGNVTISDSKGFIGLVTVGGGVLNTITAVTDITNPVALKGNVSISNIAAGANYIGLASVNIGGTLPALTAGVAAIGFATVFQASAARTITGNVTISDSKGYIGLVTVTQASSARTITGNVTLSDSKGYIGLVTVTQASAARTITGNVTLSDAKTFIGLSTTVTGAGDRFIGLVTAVAQNAGTNKTLIHKTIALTQASIATIAVPSNTFKITRLLLNSDATVRVNLKSGATYLTGNVTVGITLNPGGGWVENGAPDSPAYIGLAGAAAIVLEKFDLTGTSAKIGGKLIYFDE